MLTTTGILQMTYSLHKQNWPTDLKQMELIWQTTDGLFTWHQQLFSSPRQLHYTNYNPLNVARFVVHLNFRQNWFNDFYWGYNNYYARRLSINWHLLTLVHKLLSTAILSYHLCVTNDIGQPIFLRIKTLWDAFS